MKTLFLKLSIALGGWLLLTPANSLAQQRYDITPASKIWVDGTSTLRNWKADVGSFEGYLVVDSATISEIYLQMEVVTMDGGRGADMNSKIHKALRAEQSPHISFQGSGVVATAGATAQGKLSIGGQTKAISLQASGSIGSGSLEGKYKVKLSDYDIEPPTAMFGQIVCHDDVEIHFQLTLEKTQQ